jgi:hypothetical protein
MITALLAGALPIAYHVSTGRPPVMPLWVLANRFVAKSSSAAPMRSPDLCRPSKSRIAVLVMPTLPACRSADMISSAIGSPNILPKARAAEASQYSHTAIAAVRWDASNLSFWSSRA